MSRELIESPTSRTVETYDVIEAIAAFGGAVVVEGAIENYVSSQKRGLEPEQVKGFVNTHLDLLVNCGRVLRLITETSTKYYLLH